MSLAQRICVGLCRLPSPYTGHLRLCQFTEQTCNSDRCIALSLKCVLSLRLPLRFDIALYAFHVTFLPTLCFLLQTKRLLHSPPWCTSYISHPLFLLSAVSFECSFSAYSQSVYHAKRTTPQLHTLHSLTLSIHPDMFRRMYGTRYPLEPGADRPPSRARARKAEHVPVSCVPL